MKRIFLTLALLAPFAASAQIINPGVQQQGSVSAGNCATWAGVNAIQDGGAPCGAPYTANALTKTDDTNVTLTLSGTPATALLQAVGLQLGWTGTLAAGRLNSNVVQGVVNDTNVTGSIAAQVMTLGWAGTLSSARGGFGADISAANGVPNFTAGVAAFQAPATLSRTNDTNVTLTLGGTPATALLQSVSMTLGWSGTLAKTRGGLGGAITNVRAGDMIYFDGSGNPQILAGNNSGTQVLSQNASGVPSWSAAGSGTVTSVTCFGSAITTSGTCATAATKSDQQTGTSTSAVVTPSQQQNHDSASKAWVIFAGASGTISAAYNVTSVSRAGAGSYTLNFTTAFASTAYGCSGSIEDGATNGIVKGNATGKTASAMPILTVNFTPATYDPAAVFVECFGRQ